MADPGLTLRFASAEWVAAVVREVNAHPDLARALDGLGPDLAAVVEREPGVVPQGLAAWGRHAAGRIVEARVLEDEDDVLELEPAYVVRAPLATWRSLLEGREDPVRAALTGRVKVKGDLDALVRRAGWRYIVEEALRRVPTDFPGEEKG